MPRSASPTRWTASGAAGFTRSIAGRRTTSYGPTTTPVTATFPNGFPNNSHFTAAQDASFLQLGLNQLPPNPQLAAPSLAHRDKKINLNYPLPVSNDPNEAVRQKWISDAYQTLKAILPPLAVDTPEELAQLSQYVINIIDFRDPDATMTHWINPDVSLAVWNGTGRCRSPRS